jgi:hypothetical protein
MGNPQRLDPLDTEQRADESGRMFLVSEQARERKTEVAEKQVHEEERGSVENVIGWMLLMAAGVTLAFSPIDLRAGGHMIEWIAAGIGVPGVVLIGLGWIVRHRLEEEVRPKGE